MDESILKILQTPILFFFISLCARAIFSFLETSITALRLFKLKEIALQAPGRYEVLLQALEKNQHRVLITILIANSLADVTTAALATHITETIFKRLNFSSGLGYTLGIAIASAAIIIFGEIIPKNLARGRGERLFKSMLWLTNIVFYVLYPVTSFLIRFSNFIIFTIIGKQAETGNDWI